MSTNDNDAKMATSTVGAALRTTIYSQSQVSAKVGDETDEVCRVGGTLTLVAHEGNVSVAWTPGDDGDASQGWVVTPDDPHVGYSTTNDALDVSPTRKRAESFGRRFAFSVDLRDLRSFYCHEHNRKNTGEPWLKFISRDGSSYVPLYFTMKKGADTAVANFITELQRYATLKRSAKEVNLILFTDERKEQLEQSVSMLFHHQPQPFLSKLMNNPVGTTMSSLTRVSQMVQNQLYDAFVDTGNGAVDIDEQRRAMESLMRLEDPDAADGLRCHSTSADGGGFEMVTRIVLPTRPAVAREQPLNAEQLAAYRRADGSFDNLRQLKLLIFRGVGCAPVIFVYVQGLEPSLRKEVWPFLLGQFKWSSTSAERETLREQQVDDYYRIKLQWKSILPAQEARFTEFANRKGLIEKDVNRTDRTLRYFEGDNNGNVRNLYDILMTYCMYNFDLGYVQGMSDFLAPILFVVDNEVDSFWCFVGLMDRLHGNFEMDQALTRRQLMQLRDLVVIVNPKLANYLESHDSDNMYFTFRWLLVHFKREFSFATIQRLWEVLWTDMPCANFHLLICVAILDLQTSVIIENKFGLTEILKHVNDLSGHIDVDVTLSTAEAIYHQLAATQDKLPTHICDILGFECHSSNSQVSSANNSVENSPARHIAGGVK